MQKEIKKLDIEIIEEMVDELIIENKVFKGVKLSNGKTVKGKYCIVTTGTYTDAKTMKGTSITEEGPEGLKTNKTLSKSFKDNGFKLLRLKTGTPPRFKESTLDFKNFEPEPGTNDSIFITPFCTSAPTVVSVIRESVVTVYAFNPAVSEILSANAFIVAS
jgi:tRNA uridine 5-carboxymethylaminomethyl modification enzyme